MQIAILGLGKMGRRIAQKLARENHDVVVWNRSPEVLEAIKKEVKVTSFTSIAELVKHLKKPRVVWLMLPAGDATDTVLSEVEKYLEADDIVINGANNNYVDTERQYKHFSENNIKFLGIGVSGGVIAEFKGYPLMVGGHKEAYAYITPILDSLSKPEGGHEYFGTGGAGHFVKMVHNAIEYAYMQGIGEGFGVLEKSDYNFDLVKVAKLYDRGSLISGFMMKRTIEALERDPKMESFSGVIGSATGETVWTVEEAEKKRLFIDVIKRSLEIRKESVSNEKIQKSFAAKLVQALRLAFGGHK
ncbi:MAG TPA: NADP-dependent phosphogluconate dehydrogenase [Patescibacteria group bacterium]